MHTHRQIRYLSPKPISSLLPTTSFPPARPDGITPRRLVSWTTGAHATDHPYFNNGSALFEDPNWAGGAMMEMIAEGEASAVATIAKLQVSSGLGRELVMASRGLLSHKCALL